LKVSGDNGEVTVNINSDGTVSISSSGAVSINSEADIAINTGSGGFTVNGKFLLTEKFLDWMTQNATSFGMGNMGAPVPIFPAANASLVSGANAPDGFKTDKT
jgi:hypothetical protein